MAEEKDLRAIEGDSIHFQRLRHPAPRRRRRRRVTEPAYSRFEGTLLTVCSIERDQPLLDLRFATPQTPCPKPKPDHERRIDGDLPSDPAELAGPERGDQPF